MVGGCVIKKIHIPTISGLQYRERVCLNSTGCRGEPLQYQICSIHPCPPSAPEWRDEQCSRYVILPQTFPSVKIILKHIISDLYIMINSRRERILGCLLHWSQKFYNKVFLFVGLTTMGTFIEFWMVGSLSWVSKHCYYHWGCAEIVLPLSYPFLRSLWKTTSLLMICIK